MQTTKRQWIAAVPVAIALHAMIFAVMTLEPSTSGAKQAGVGGIEVSLGPAGGAPGGIAAPDNDLPETEDSEQQDPPKETTVEEQLPEVPPAEEEIVETTPLPAEAPIIEEVMAEDPVATEIPAVEPDIIEALSEPEQIPVPPEEPVLVVAEIDPPKVIEDTKPELAIEPVKPQPTPKLAQITPPKRPKPPEPEVKPEPSPTPAKQLIDAPVDKAPPLLNAPTETAALPPSDAGVGGKSGSQDQQNTGAGYDTQGGGIPGETTDYLATLQAWLEKHKVYPKRAKRRREEGTAMLYFVMDRKGNVINAELRESSGSKTLDKEVMRMIDRAQPLPKMPAAMTSAQLELVVPVQFYLR